MKANFKFWYNHLGGGFYGNSMRIWGIQNDIICGMILNNPYLQIHLNTDKKLDGNVTSSKLRLLSHFPGKVTLAAYKLDERRGSVVRISGVNFLYGSWTWWKQTISLANSREFNWLKVSYQAYKLRNLDFLGFDFVLKARYIDYIIKPDIWFKRWFLRSLLNNPKFWFNNIKY